MQLNPAQQLAITLQNRDLLVTAGAGTGKTTVLVERVLYKLRQHLVDSLDDLLIVTFTEKAAQEMRDRVARELGRSSDLRHHLAQLPRAQISTIDSFCSRLLRERFLEAEVEPTFRILDPRGRREALDEALRRAFHRWYAQGRKGLGAKFQSLVELTGYDEQGENLKHLVLRLYDYSRVTADPEAYLQRLYSRTTPDSAADLPYFESMVAELIGGPGPEQEGIWTRGLRLYHAALRLAEDEGKGARQMLAWYDAVRDVSPATLADPARQEALVRDLVTTGRASMNGGFTLVFPRAPSGANAVPGFKLLHEAAKEALLHPAIRALPWGVDALLADEAENREFLQVLISLVREMDEWYGLYKKRNGLLDFSDLEVRTSRLLREHGSSLDLGHRFREVLVDEFQDVNALQNQILAGLSPPEGRFRVGDVKQSIYQFRLADPTIFLGESLRRTPVKASAKGSDAGDVTMAIPQTLSPPVETSPPGTDPLLIFLAENHRSRPAILGLVNHVFGRLFRREEIGSDYIDQALVAGRTDDPGRPVELHFLQRTTAPPDESDHEPDGGSGGGDQGIGSADGLVDPPWTSIQREAHFTARLLYNLIVKENPRVPMKDGSTRPARWEDAAVLLRSKSAANAFLEAFEAAGIPATLTEGGSLLEEEGVRDFRCLLSVIDNPRDDVNLAAFLRSPFCAIKDSDLFRVRLAWPAAPSFLDAIAATAYESDPEEAAGVFFPRLEGASSLLDWCGPKAPDADSLLASGLRSRLRRILDHLRTWREEHKKMELSRFLDHLVREIEFTAVILARRGPSRGRASLEKFLALAQEYEAERGPSLHGFLHRISTLERSEKIDGVPLATEGASAVAITTIHKAKGLEYPFVLLPRLSWQPPADRIGAKIRIGPEWVGVRRLNYESWTQEDTPARRVLEVHQEEERRAEEARILYVALTRARERLILVGSPKRRVNQDPPRNPNPRKLWEEISLRGSSVALDWILSVLPWEDRIDLYKSEGRVGYGFRDLPIELHVHDTEMVDREAREWLGNLTKEKADRRIVPEPSGTMEMSHELDGLLQKIARSSQVPPLAGLDDLKGKYWVTELKSLADRGRAQELLEEGTGRLVFASESEVPPLLVPSPPKSGPVVFAALDAELAARIGSIYHNAISRMDLVQVSPEGLERQFEAFARTPWWEGIPRDPLLEQGIASFFQSDLGRQLSRVAGQHQGRVEREVNFSRRWSIAQLTPWLPNLRQALDQDPRWKRPDWDAALKEAWVLVQGRIDCLFDSGDGWVLLDWKTDRVSGEELKARAASYAPQMGIYRDAVNSLWGRYAGSWLVFLLGGQVVEVR